MKKHKIQNTFHEPRDIEKKKGEEINRILLKCSIKKEKKILQLIKENNKIRNQGWNQLHIKSFQSISVTQSFSLFSIKFQSGLQADVATLGGKVIHGEFKNSSI